MKNFVFKYGFIGGLISAILGTLNWLLIARPIGVEGSQAVGYISITLSLLCIPLGIRYYRDKLNHGSVGFGKAFKIGLGITAMASLVMGLHSVLFFAFQKDEFLEWQRSELSEAELVAFNEQVAAMPDFIFTPWAQGMVMFFTVFLIGIVINFISALLLKREAPEKLNTAV